MATATAERGRMVERVGEELRGKVINQVAWLIGATLILGAYRLLVERRRS